MNLSAGYSSSSYHKYITAMCRLHWSDSAHTRQRKFLPWYVMLTLKKKGCKQFFDLGAILLFEPLKISRFGIMKKGKNKKEIVIMHKFTFPAIQTFVMLLAFLSFLPYNIWECNALFLFCHNRLTYKDDKKSATLPNFFKS